ncbi:shikimate dehydrogenase [Winogradskyella sp. PC-19]|uniref:shikimate dehydrogenase family protein n=1 Tax=unclassified Winogradskyella TaxID=2615021 RepID=UPI000B3C77FD|nr:MULTISPECIES: shikimate dehydrogenase [unclassified Winogradskyella]ARV10505.1 shikimate dehydrogenase [Winogradskyella sp. PC-19]RZN74243.1 MAG: shikimate dehydrogenase [Winogradskyella sp.]
MDNGQKESKYKFGLIGKDIDYSFSRGYFAEKFKAENLPHEYVNFDLQNISEFEDIFKNSENIKGLNVTIPYKETVIPFLDKLNKRAKEIGAVNTIKISKKGKLIGHNTDFYGFKNSLKPHLQKHHKKALILGTGGASKAIAYALEQLKIEFHFVSRTKKEGVTFTYADLTDAIINAHQILINCSPVGTFPDINTCPDIPYDGISEHHILYDLIYNPPQTKFLRLGESQNAITINGSKMLELQAEKSWEIWNK